MSKFLLSFVAIAFLACEESEPLEYWISDHGCTELDASLFLEAVGKFNDLAGETAVTVGGRASSGPPDRLWVLCRYSKLDGPTLGLATFQGNIEIITGRLHVKFESEYVDAFTAVAMHELGHAVADAPDLDFTDEDPNQHIMSKKLCVVPHPVEYDDVDKKTILKSYDGLDQ